MVWTEPGPGWPRELGQFENICAEDQSKTAKLRFLYGLKYQGLYLLRIKDYIRCCKGTRTHVSFLYFLRVINLVFLFYCILVFGILLLPYSFRYRIIASYHRTVCHRLTLRSSLLNQLFVKEISGSNQDYV